MINTRFHQWVLVIAVVVHVVTAWKSVGYHSEDEHHQVIGIAQSRSGELKDVERPWEFEARIRPTVLPWIAIGVFKTADAVGLYDPFTKTFLLRSLTVALALIAVHGFVRAVIVDIGGPLQRPFVLLSYFLWFLPFLHVRFCSETWSGLLFLMGLTAVLEDDRSRWWALRTGLFMTMAIWVRAPMAIAVAGLMAWLWLVQKENWRVFVKFAVTILVVLALSVVIDSHFYGTTTFSIGRYFTMAIQGDPAHIFDTLPWYYYVPWVVKYAIPPMGAAIVLAVAILLVKHPKHVLVWVIVPFVLVHSFIPHKELRFLYPLADLVPLLLVFGFTEFRTWLKVAPGPTAIRILGISVLAMVLILNLVGLDIVMTSPAGNGRVVIAQELQRIDPPPNAQLTYIIGSIDQWRIRLPRFYAPDGMIQTSIDISHVDEYPIGSEYLVAHEQDVALISERTGQAFDPLIYSEKDLPEQILRWYNWGERPARWGLYSVIK